ncbi:MAG: hypothetical protein AB1772_06355 [Candidatus Zixiibacteriota bacterium]
MSEKWRRFRFRSVRRLRRPSDDLSAFPWHIGVVPRPTGPDDDSVGASVWRTAVFVVHGIGTQTVAETAAALRSGTDDLLERLDRNARFDGPSLPPPYIRDGYWANYDDVRTTFEKELRPYNEPTKLFFETLWKQRLFSALGTVGWLIGQQLRLLWAALTLRVKPWAGLVYVLMQLPLLFSWFFAWLRHPRVVSGYLTDVRLYMRPKGVTEGAIVQRIDQVVRTRFMQLLGLSPDFEPLQDHEKLDVAGERYAFEKVVWVAHSLGTVISYNVLADLFRRAEEIDRLPAGPDNDTRKKGVALFRNGLVRFVTLGSPLDKVATLYPHRLTPWTAAAYAHATTHAAPWWVNCYHVLDPVSGSLDARRICRVVEPANFHIRLAHLPVLAHLAYWRDVKSLWFALDPIYPSVFRKEQPPKPMVSWQLTLLAFAAYLIWTVLLAAVIVAGVIWLVASWTGALARKVSAK